MPTDPIDVSVVVPTRQRPELLARALRSILEQRFDGQIEVIVVFDQDEPVEPEVAIGEGRRLRLLRNERQPGLAGARNTGILAARGSYVAHCDDDDEWLPDKLSRQRLAIEDAQGDVVVTGTTIVYEDHTIDRIPRSTSVGLHELAAVSHAGDHPSSIMVRREALLDEIGLVDEDIPWSYGEDYEWLLRAARLRPLVVLPDPLVRAHWHRSSFFAQRWRAIVEGSEYLLARYPEFREERKGFAWLQSRMAFAYAAMGEGSRARALAGRTLRLDPIQPRAYLAILVSTGLISADALMRLAHRAGRGI